MARLRFGTLLAPHHPTGEHPTLQFQRDLDFAEHLDRLGFDEFLCGEHHSSGWEMAAQAAAKQEQQSEFRPGGLPSSVDSLPVRSGENPGGVPPGPPRP